MKLRSEQADRAAGVLVGAASGDALGAGYEFGRPMEDHVPVPMFGGGGPNWAPGEWTDDTSMAIVIARSARFGADLRSDEVRDEIARRWIRWARTAPDVGVQTREVFSDARLDATAAEVAAASLERFERNGRAAGNGSLKRTAPVALAALESTDYLREAAVGLSDLTHPDPEAREACFLWSYAIRHAVLHGSFEGLFEAVELLPPDRGESWLERLNEAELNPPSYFQQNDLVVQALQAAWSAIVRTPVPVQDAAHGSFPAQHLQRALEAAVRGGNETASVAAIAGGLLGARWGVSAIPAEWQRIVHGWPGLRARDLSILSLQIAQASGTDQWPAIDVVDYRGYGDLTALVPHPYDPGVLLSGVDSVRDLPRGVDAVVSLCRLGAGELPLGANHAREHVLVWLVDSDDPAKNRNLDFVINDAATAVAQLRAERRTVLLHGVQAVSRTPTVAALYGARLTGQPIEEALADVSAVLPNANPNPAFRAALQRLQQR